MIQLDKGAIGQIIHEQLKQLEEQVGFGVEPDIEERDEQDFEDLKKANNDTNVEVLAENEKNLRKSSRIRKAPSSLGRLCVEKLVKSS